MKVTETIIAQGMQAARRGDTAGETRAIARVTVQAAVQRAIFCQSKYCGHILDQSTAGVFTFGANGSEGVRVYCGGCVPGVIPGIHKLAQEHQIPWTLETWKGLQSFRPGAPDTPAPVQLSLLGGE